MGGSDAEGFHNVASALSCLNYPLNPIVSPTLLKP
jgi:hypothetical protein